MGLNYKDHIDIDKNLLRPTEVDTLLADYRRQKRFKMGAKSFFDELVTIWLKVILR